MRTSAESAAVAAGWVFRYAPQDRDVPQRPTMGASEDAATTHHSSTQAQGVSTSTAARGRGPGIPQYPADYHHAPSAIRRVPRVAPQLSPNPMPTPQREATSTQSQRSLIPVRIPQRTSTQVLPSVDHGSSSSRQMPQTQQAHQQPQLAGQRIRSPQVTHFSNHGTQSQDVGYTHATSTRYPPATQSRHAYGQPITQIATVLSGTPSTVRPPHTMSQAPRTLPTPQPIPGPSRLPASPATPQSSQRTSQAPPGAQQRRLAQRQQTQRSRQVQQGQSTSTRGDQVQGAQQGGNTLPKDNA